MGLVSCAGHWADPIHSLETKQKHNWSKTCVVFQNSTKKFCWKNNYNDSNLCSTFSIIHQKISLKTERCTAQKRNPNRQHDRFSTFYQLAEKEYPVQCEQIGHADVAFPPKALLNLPSEQKLGIIIIFQCFWKMTLMLTKATFISKILIQISSKI